MVQQYGPLTQPQKKPVINKIKSIIIFEDVNYVNVNWNIKLVLDVFYFLEEFCLGNSRITEHNI